MELLELVQRFVNNAEHNMGQSRDQTNYYYWQGYKDGLNDIINEIKKKEGV